MLTRRQFIKAGIIGGAALTAAGLFYSRGLKEAPSTASSSLARGVSCSLP